MNLPPDFFIIQEGKSLFMEKKRKKRKRITAKSCFEMFLKNKTQLETFALIVEKKRRKQKKVYFVFIIRS